MNPSRPLDRQEADRIARDYGVLVSPDVRVKKVPTGYMATLEPAKPREQAESNWRAMVRRRRVGAAKKVKI